MEQIDYNLLFRWFVGLGVDDPVWDHSTLSKNRDRLLAADVAAKFLAAVLGHPKVKGFLSTSTSRSTERWWKPGPRSRASAPRTAPTSRRRRGATASAASTTRSAAMRPMPRPHYPRVRTIPCSCLSSRSANCGRSRKDGRASQGCLATEGVLCQSALDPDPLLMYQAL